MNIYIAIEINKVPFQCYLTLYRTNFYELKKIAFLFFKTLKHVFFIEVPNWERNAIKG